MTEQQLTESRKTDAPFFVDGTIKVHFLVEPNGYNCRSVQIDGVARDTGEPFSHFATSPDRVNVFQHGDPNPIDPALVDKQKWNGSALVFPYTTSAGKEAWRFEALSFDLEAGPISERVVQSHDTSPFMTVE